MIPRESATGAIYDLGYRGYEGPRLGRTAAVTTLFWASLRAAFGLGRSGKAKLVPWGLSAIGLVPAAVAAAIAALVPVGGASPFSYDNYLFGMATVFSLFLAAQAPELVSGDQRHRVLALYFSHALLRVDYGLAKLAAMAAALYVLGIAPMLVLFLGAVLAASDVPAALADQLENVPQIVLAPALFAVPLATIGVAVAAWTPRRAYATGAIIAVFIVTAAVGGIVSEAARGTLADWVPLINPFLPIDATRDLLLGGPNPEARVGRGVPAWVPPAVTVGIAAAGAAAVAWRYRRLDP